MKILKKVEAWWNGVKTECVSCGSQLQFGSEDKAIVVEFASTTKTAHFKCPVCNAFVWAQVKL